MAMSKHAEAVRSSLAGAARYDALLARHLPQWAERELAAEQAGARRLPQATISELRQSGLLAAPIPIQLGGAGADLLTLSDVVRTTATRAPATALCLAMPLANAANARVTDGAVPAPEQSALSIGRSWIAQRACAGEILGVANSEPGAQGDLANTRTSASRDAQGQLVLTGEKCFATLGPDADYFLCSARTEQGLLDAFFVARDAPGVSLADDWHALGMRLTASVSLRLEQAPAAAGFLYPGAIAKVSARHWSTLLLAAVFLGVGEGALATVRQAPSKLTGFARAKLAEHALTLEAARSFVESVARADQIPCPPETAERARRAKTFAAKAAVEMATCALTMAGGHAYSPAHPLARFMLDAAAGPLLRPPLPQAMDALAEQLFGAP
jgi:alkylation response protein AidB-like acyl-CoA dehydrogenase